MKYGVQSIYMMSWILYGLGDRKEAFRLYEVGKNKAVETNNTEFMAKLNILYHTYEKTNVNKILSELSVLEDLNTAGLFRNHCADSRIFRGKF
ncbi:hypothetical protein OE903_23310 [Bacillus sp. B6(2022)]|nr:hypothetical protein [Bacillus sp. B6(2022)]